MNEKNKILEENWKARRKIEEENNIDEIFKAYQARQQKHPSEYFSGKPVSLQTKRGSKQNSGKP
jgi:hypothetical protein